MRERKRQGVRWRAALAWLFATTLCLSSDGSLISDEILELMKRTHAALGGKVGLAAALPILARSSEPTSKLFEIVQELQSKQPWKEEASWTCFDAVFTETQPLGVLFKEHSHGFQIQEMSPTGMAKASGKLQVGDIFVALNCEGVAGIDLQDLADKITVSRGRMILRLCRKPPETQSKPSAPKPQVSRPITTSRPTESLFKVVVQEKKSLGLGLLEDLSVQAIAPSSVLISEVQEGDVLVSVNGVSLRGKDLDAAVPIIKSAAAPLLLEFETKRKITSQNSDLKAEQVQVGGFHEAASMEDHRGSTVQLVLTSPPILAGAQYELVHAQFGEASSCSLQNITLFSPRKGLVMGCKPKTAGTLPENAIVVLLRGECTFVTKSRIVEQAGGNGLIVVTRSFEPLVSMPHGAGELSAGPINIPVAMMSWSDGGMLGNLLKTGSLQGVLTGPGCSTPKLAIKAAGVTENDSMGEESTSGDEYAVETTASGATRERFKVSRTAEMLLWDSESNRIHSIYGIYANFGPAYEAFPTVSDVEPGTPVFAPDQRDGCKPFNGQEYAGATVILYRGVCTYAEKAINVQNAGGKGMVVINHEQDIKKLFPLVAQPELVNKIRIPAILVNATAGEVLKQILLPEEGADQDQALMKSPKPKSMQISKLYRKTFYYCNRNQGTVCGVNEFP